MGTVEFSAVFGESRRLARRRAACRGSDAVEAGQATVRIVIRDVEDELFTGPANDAQ
jgi:hypothetical protein